MKTISAISWFAAMLAAAVLFSDDNVCAGVVTCSYDSLNRLTNVNCGNGAVLSYTYDVTGNRLNGLFK